MKISFGGIAGGIIKLAFSATDVAQKGICGVAEALADDKKTKIMIHKKSYILSNTIQKLSRPVSIFTEKAIDGTVIIAGELTGKGAKVACEICNASAETTKKAEQYGKIAGKAAVGFAIGTVAVPSLISSAALSGTMGAAEITSGLATLGASGGMSAGITVLNAVTATTTCIGALTPEAEIDFSHQLEKAADCNNELDEEEFSDDDEE